MKKKELLEIIYMNCGFQYISDLRQTKSKDKVYEVIKSINVQDFTVEDWIAAYKYLIHYEGNDINWEKEKIKDQILKQLF